MLLSELDEKSIFINVIKYLFPQLIINHQTLLHKYLIKLINIIINSFYIENYKYYFFENNYRNCKWLLLLLLPFINTSIEQYDKIINLNDIYTKKVKEVDIKIETPKYIWSNIQYSICNRNPIKERNFNEQYIEQNYYLMVETILTCAHKLFPDWENIIQYSINHLDYIVHKKSDFYISKLDRELIEKLNKLYDATNDIIINNKLEDIDIVNDFNINKNELPVKKLHYLYTGTIYDTIANCLYKSIKDIHFLLHDIQCKISDNMDYYYPFILVIENIFDLNKMNFIEWDNHDEQLDKYKTNIQIIWTEMLSSAERNIGYSINEISLNNINLRLLLILLLVSFDSKSKNIYNAKEDGYISISNSGIETENMSYDDIKSSLDSINIKYIYKFIIDCITEFKHTWYGSKLFNIQNRQIISSIEYKNTNIVTINFTYYFAKLLVTNDKKESYALYWNSLNDASKTIILNRLNKSTKLIKWFNLTQYLKKIININLIFSDDLKKIITIDDLNKEQNLEIIHNELYNNIKKDLTETIFNCLITNGIFTAIHNTSVQQSLDKKSSIWESSFSFLTCTRYKYMDVIPVYNKYGEIEKTVDIFDIFKKNNLAQFDVYNFISQIGFVNKFMNNRVSFITAATGAGKTSQVPKLYLYYLKAILMNTKGRVVLTTPRIKPTVDTATAASYSFGVPIFIDKNETNNYYVQLQYKGNSHKNNMANNLILKIITDGSLLLELNNPICKYISRDKNTNDIKYIDTQNLYDVIIIDEAHEHNKNIDLILTMIRFQLNINNSIKLVIMSATLDDDEHIYRRFYRDINDNRKFPLSNFISNNELDRINIDRRFHLSPPDKTTLFSIKEIYEPRKTPVEIVLDILNNSNTGDILLFQPGVSDINKIISEINEQTNKNIIAIPYLRTLSNYHKDFVGEIDKNKKNLHISKKDYFASTLDLTQGVSNYDRIIIVATNIAEASITISSLKYVIDTGTHKVVSYDSKRNLTSINLLPIAEINRVQRKGRVGRSSDGYVYYTYEKGSRKNNLVNYNITNENIIYDILNLYQNINDTEFISYDPNYKDHFKYYKTLETITDANIVKLIKNQYYANNMFYTYYGNKEMYDYELYKFRNKYYNSGYNYASIIDTNATFYIIHPDENKMTRNIIGNVITTDKNFVILTNNTIFSLKIDAFMKKLTQENFIIKDTGKTRYGKNFLRLTECINLGEAETNIDYIKCILIALAYNCEYKMAKIIAVLLVTNGDCGLLLLRDSSNRIIGINPMYINNSDCLTFLSVMDDFENYVIDKINYTRNAYYYNKKFKINIDKINEILHGEVDITQNDDNYIKTENLLSGEIEKEIDTNIEYDNFSIKNGLNPKILKDCYKKYIKIKKSIDKMKFTYKQLIKQFTNEIIKFYNFEKSNILISIFISVFPYNVCQRVYNNKYISFFHPDVIFEVNSFLPYKYIPRTFVKHIYISDLILFITINADSNTITSLNYFKTDYLTHNIFKIFKIKINKNIDIIKLREYVNNNVINVKSIISNLGVK